MQGGMLHFQWFGGHTVKDAGDGGHWELVGGVKSVPGFDITRAI